MESSKMAKWADARERWCLFTCTKKTLQRDESSTRRKRHQHGRAFSSQEEAREEGKMRTGNGLGALGDGMLGELSREDKSDGSLDLSGRDRALLVVLGKRGSLGRDSLPEGGRDATRRERGEGRRNRKGHK
jgi:hypothetical protein